MLNRWNASLSLHDTNWVTLKLDVHFHNFSLVFPPILFFIQSRLVKLHFDIGSTFCTSPTSLILFHHVNWEEQGHLGLYPASVWLCVHERRYSDWEFRTLNSWCCSCWSTRGESLWLQIRVLIEDTQTHTITHLFLSKSYFGRSQFTTRTDPTYPSFVPSHFSPCHHSWSWA